MTWQSPKGLHDSVLRGMTGLVLSVLISAPGAFAQRELIDSVIITSGTVATSGVVTVVGIASCLEPVQVMGLCVNVAQPVGRTTSIAGSRCDNGEDAGICDPDSPFHFSLEVFPSNGFFAPGKASVSGFFNVCTPDLIDCDVDDFQQSIRLRR